MAKKNDLSVWSLLVGATLLGSIMTSISIGCRPSAIGDVDTTTGSTSPDNVTAASSDVTTETPAVTAETPASADSAGSETSPAPAEPAQAARLVAVVKEAAKPEDVLKAAGDWPAVGGELDCETTCRR